MSEVTEVNTDLNKANLDSFNGDGGTEKTTVKAKSAKTAVKAGSKRAGRVSKKRRSAATLAARTHLKSVIKAAMKQKGISYQDFADMQGNQRQYIYRVLSEKEDAASLDQLVGFAEDIGVDVDITAVMQPVQQA